jgi:hypothetical protein
LLFGNHISIVFRFCELMFLFPFIFCLVTLILFFSFYFISLFQCFPFSILF